MWHRNRNSILLNNVEGSLPYRQLLLLMAQLRDEGKAKTVCDVLCFQKDLHRLSLLEIFSFQTLQLKKFFA